MLKYFVNSSFLFLLHIGMHLCLNFEADSLTLKGTTVKLVCDVGQTSFITSVSLLKDGSSKSTCDNANSCFPSSSDSGRYQYFSNVSSVTVEIPNLNHTTDTGIWKCKLGQREEMDYKLDVITIPTSTEFTQTIPDSNSSELVENVKLSGRCYCIFPPPSVKLYFKVGTRAFQFREEISDRFINKRNNTSSCEPYEFDVEVSNFTVTIMGLTNVFFEMHFGDYKTSGVVGPFSFSSKAVTLAPPLAGCNYSDAGLFFDGFSCFLIVLITSIMIILACKILPETFGDLRTNKKIKSILIVVFNVVALIIGFILGFITMKNCDQRDRGLVLGLVLGFLLAITLVMIFCIYPRKCDSKKGYEI